ncbi:MAG TPA: hypothetical protein VFK70_10930, partial [Vicinamibacteria bacterium]|nr:hypothetical protein [Vicinamibacteria bacterium]
MAARRILKLLALGLSLAIPARAADAPRDPTQDLWEDASPASRRPARPSRRIRRLKLDRRALTEVMAGAPQERSREAREHPLVIALPAPEGGFQRFAVHESPVMEPDLASQHPEIKTYSGRGLDKPATTVRLDLTPLGLHASVRGPEGMWYVDPAPPSEAADYRSFYGRDAVENPHGTMTESAAAMAEVSTDRGYYHAVDTVNLHGAGFAPRASIAVTISASEGALGTRTLVAVADARGAFDLGFIADPD